MKCKYCGNEIADGKVYCDKCGKPVQMVPDYNALEEDILPGIVSDEKNTTSDNDSTVTESEKDNKEKEDTPGDHAILQKSKSFFKTVVTKKRIIILVIVLIAVSSVLIYYFSPSNQISLGKEKFKNSDYAGALSYFLVASNIDNSASLYSDIGTCYYRLKDYDNAKKYYESSLKKDNKEYDAFIGLVNMAKDEPDYSELEQLNASAVTDEQKKIISKYIVPVPEFSKEGGNYDDDIELVLSNSENLDIYYTLDGSTPDKTNGTLYRDPISITDGKTVVTARCINRDGFFGDVVSNEYSISYETPDMPVVNPDGGTFTVPTQITITCNQKNAVIYYAWDESEPSVNSTKYTGPIDVPEGQHILSAVAITKNKLSSAIYRGSFSYMPSPDAVIPETPADTATQDQAADSTGEAQ